MYMNCEQVVTLLTFYIENKLNKQLAKKIKLHLENCPECMDKYVKLKKILENYKMIKSKIIEENDYMLDTSIYETPQYQNFKLNLSAYVDNELSDNENIRIKKIAISNPLARRDLENIYSFKQLLQSSFNKTKNDLKQDYSRKTLEKIYKNENHSEIPSFYKLAGVFTFIVIFAIIGVINILKY